MPINIDGEKRERYSIAKDVSLTINTGSGILRLKLTGFEANPVYKKFSHRPIDQPPIYAAVADGWKGTFQLDRQDSTVDDFCCYLEDQCWGRWGQQKTFPGEISGDCTITETISEGGAVSRYRYMGVCLTIVSIGRWELGSLVKQVLEFEASRRINLQQSPQPFQTLIA